MNYHTGTGKIIYDPHRGSMKRRTQWWCVAIVDKEVAGVADDPGIVEKIAKEKTGRKYIPLLFVESGEALY